jgi:hypothetical protein
MDFGVPAVCLCGKDLPFIGLRAIVQDIVRDIARNHLAVKSTFANRLRA